MVINDSVQHENRGDSEMRRMEMEWQEIREARGEPEPTKTGPDEDDPNYWPWWEKYETLQEFDSVWPQNRKEILHLVEKLKAEFPIRKIEMDDAFRDPTCSAP